MTSKTAQFTHDQIKIIFHGCHYMTLKDLSKITGLNIDHLRKILADKG